MLESIKFTSNPPALQIIDQLRLPHEQVYVDINGVEDGYDAIKRMVVRGAPAIAIVGAFAVSLEVYKAPAETAREVLNTSIERIVSARPTAVNIANMARDLNEHCKSTSNSELRAECLKFSETMMAEDLVTNKKIGEYGWQYVQANKRLEKATLVTICNTGSLATSGWGTALGIVRQGHLKNELEQVFALETRPYNQGARLTSFELVQEGINGTLVTDSMCAALMAKYGPDVAVVGADRVAANGDTANKIGTYQLAVLAKHHGVKFVVAAPVTTFDFNLSSGQDIVIEERPACELTSVQGVEVAAKGINVWNPSFDVTPASLIDAIVTDKGVFEKVDGVFKFDSLL